MISQSQSTAARAIDCPQCAAKALQGLRVMVHLVLAKVHLRVAEHVSEEKENQDHAGGRHHHLAQDR